MGETKIPNVYEYGIPVVVAATNNDDASLIFEAMKMFSFNTGIPLKIKSLEDIGINNFDWTITDRYYSYKNIVKSRVAVVYYEICENLRTMSPEKKPDWLTNGMPYLILVSITGISIDGQNGWPGVNADKCLRDRRIWHSSEYPANYILDRFTKAPDAAFNMPKENSLADVETTTLIRFVTPLTDTEATINRALLYEEPGTAPRNECSDLMRETKQRVMFDYIGYRDAIFPLDLYTPIRYKCVIDTDQPLKEVGDERAFICAPNVISKLTPVKAALYGDPRYTSTMQCLEHFTPKLEAVLDNLAIEFELEE